MARRRGSLADEISSLLDMRHAEPGDDGDDALDGLGPGSLLAEDDVAPVAGARRLRQTGIDLGAAGAKYAGRVVSQKTRSARQRRVEEVEDEEEEEEEEGCDSDDDDDDDDEEEEEEDDDDDDDEDGGGSGDDDELVTEAEGLKLWRSSRTPTGYRAVYASGNRFLVQVHSGGKNVHLGTHGTAVQAAVAVARFWKDRGRVPEEDEDEDNNGSDASSRTPLVTESSGFKLIMSSRSGTGYKGVGILPQANARKPYNVRGPGPETRHIGSFATAVEGAVAYARFVRQGARGETKLSSTKLSSPPSPPPPPPPPAAPPAAPAAAPLAAPPAWLDLKEMAGVHGMLADFKLQGHG